MMKLRNLTCRTLLLLAALLLLPTLAFADTLTVTTDKTTYAPGQTMKITAVYKKNDGTPITRPKTREIRINNPVGTTLVQTSMTNAGSGTYTYSYTTSSSAPAGTWEVRARFVRNGITTTATTYPTVAVPDTIPPVTSASPAGGSYTAAHLIGGLLGAPHYQHNHDAEILRP
jgi:hypothetical protein